jgi:hypothetical protein
MEATFLMTMYIDDIIQVDMKSIVPEHTEEGKPHKILSINDKYFVKAKSRYILLVS